MSKYLGVSGDSSAQKLAMQQIEQQKQETEKLRVAAEEERRTLSEEMAAKRMARAKGGNRLLLAETRLNPETGVDETLGAA